MSSAHRNGERRPSANHLSEWHAQKFEPNDGFCTEGWHIEGWQITQSTTQNLQQLNDWQPEGEGFVIDTLPIASEEVIEDERREQEEV